MAQVLDEAERRARRKRLIIILVVAAVLVGGSFTFGFLRDWSVRSNADSVTIALHAEWSPIDLTGLADTYSQGTVAANGDDSSTVDLFPVVSHATFAGARFPSGEVQANYIVHGWGGGSRCLTLTAKGPVPNEVTVVQRGEGC